MATKYFNKLVRDKIPQIIKNNGDEPIIRILKDKDYIQQLNSKLLEEVNEYLKSGETEELADIVEVIYGILNYQNVSVASFEKLRAKKATERGGFKDRIFLERTESKE